MKHDMPVPLPPRALISVADPNSSPGSSDQLLQKRRISSRSIKPKRFDDELVESWSRAAREKEKTTNKEKKADLPPAQQQNGHVQMLPNQFSFKSYLDINANSVANTSQAHNESSSFIVPEKWKPRLPAKRVKISTNNLMIQHRRWKATDDLTLIFNIEVKNDLQAVFTGVEFSSKFTFSEIQDRWFNLLYNPAVSKSSFAAMKQIGSDTIRDIESKLLFNNEEEKLLKSVPSNEGNIEVFEKLLENDLSHVFVPARTAKSLFNHWSMMKQFSLLNDQTVQKPGNCILNFADTEALMLYNAKKNMIKDEDFNLSVGRETVSSNRIVKREIRTLENEIPKCHVLVDSITGTNNEEFNGNTLAVMKGRTVRYLMQSHEITLGRSSKDSSVDIDLSLEGPASKISRRQGMIKIENSGDFFLTNEGKRHIFVDGKAVLMGSKIKLRNNSVVQIIRLRFIFLINHKCQSKFRVMKNNCIKI